MSSTHKGDFGLTQIYNSKRKVSKASKIICVLGALDEVNSYLGIVKTIKNLPSDLFIKIEDVQKDLFILGGVLAGNTNRKSLSILKKRREVIENEINKMEKGLPKLYGFIIPGGSTISVHLMYARALVRKAEREVVLLMKKKKKGINQETLSYINRLSNYLFLLVRWENRDMN